MYPREHDDYRYSHRQSLPHVGHNQPYDYTHVLCTEHGMQHTGASMPDTGLMLQKTAECHYVPSTSSSTAGGPSRQLMGLKRGSKELNQNTLAVSAHTAILHAPGGSPVIQITIPMEDFKEPVIFKALPAQSAARMRTVEYSSNEKLSSGASAREARIAVYSVLRHAKGGFPWCELIFLRYINLSPAKMRPVVPNEVLPVVSILPVGLLIGLWIRIPDTASTNTKCSYSVLRDVG